MLEQKICLIIQNLIRSQLKFFYSLRHLNICLIQLILRSIREPNSEYFVLTVPYVKSSRTGFSQIRNESDHRKITPENTHIFELSPQDWELIFRFTGWEVEYRRIYKQYPWWSKIFLIHLIWRAF